MLHDFHQRLDSSSQYCAGSFFIDAIGTRVIDREHSAVTDIGIVGDGENITTGPGVNASLFQDFPEVPLSLHIHITDGPGKNSIVSENDIAVKIRSHAKRAVLKSDKSRALAFFTCIVPLLRGSNRFLPHF